LSAAKLLSDEDKQQRSAALVTTVAISERGLDAWKILIALTKRATCLAILI
jgi:hypothetical protein